MAGNTANRGGRSGRGGSSFGGGLGFLNPERVQPLVPKYANKIGKTIERVSIHYSESGVEIEVDVLVNPNGDRVTDSETVSLAEFHRRVGVSASLSDDERLRALRRKFELRLNLEFPTPGPASGSEADIQAWLDRLPLQQRRALLLSQKAFDKAYPQGFRA